MQFWKVLSPMICSLQMEDPRKPTSFSQSESEGLRTRETNGRHASLRVGEARCPRSVRELKISPSFFF